MNTRIERAMNSENLGTRITENGALDQKIWGLEAFGGGMVFSRGSGVIMDFLEWLEGFGAKDRGSCIAWDFLGEFLWNFGVFRVV
jgi:hypothetical protein